MSQYDAAIAGAAQGFGQICQSRVTARIAPLCPPLWHAQQLFKRRAPGRRLTQIRATPAAAPC
jgi:hypothetical protein